MFDDRYTFGTRVSAPSATSARRDRRPETEGFGVLTEIDMAATLRAKLGVEREPYLILGAATRRSPTAVTSTRPSGRCCRATSSSARRRAVVSR